MGPKVLRCSLGGLSQKYQSCYPLKRQKLIAWDELCKLSPTPWKPEISFKLTYQCARRSFSGSSTRMVCGVSAIRPSCRNSFRVRLSDSAAVPTMAAMSSRVS